MVQPSPVSLFGTLVSEPSMTTVARGVVARAFVRARREHREGDRLLRRGVAGRVRGEVPHGVRAEGANRNRRDVPREHPAVDSVLDRRDRRLGVGSPSR
jgi:hypothetical protein